MLEQQTLNNVEINLPGPSRNFKSIDVKQYVLDNVQVAFAKHLPQFRKAFAIGKKFAKDVTSET